MDYSMKKYEFSKDKQLFVERMRLPFAFMYAEPDADYHTGKDSFIYCGVNANWEEHELELPALPEGFKWEVYADSSRGTLGDQTSGNTLLENGHIRLIPRSVLVLTAYISL